MIVCRRVFGGLRFFVAVADLRCALRNRLVLRRREVCAFGVVGLHEQDVAIRADRRDHVEIERDLSRPCAVGSGKRFPATLVELSEAAVNRLAFAEPVVRAVNREVGFRLRIVERVDDRDRLTASGRGGWEAVCAAKVRRGIPAFDPGALQRGARFLLGPFRDRARRKRSPPGDAEGGVLDQLAARSASLRRADEVGLSPRRRGAHPRPARGGGVRNRAREQRGEQHQRREAPRRTRACRAHDLHGLRTPRCGSRRRFACSHARSHLS